MHRPRRTLCALLLLTPFCLAAPAAGLATYSYQGNLFDSVEDATPPAGAYTTANRVTGEFTLAAPLAASVDANLAADVLGYSFDDGRNTLTEANSQILLFRVSTDSLGDIAAWLIEIDVDLPGNQPGDQMLSIGTSEGGLLGAPVLDQGVILECLDSGCGQIGLDRGFRENAPGAWTLLPEPSAAALLAAALLGLAWAGRR